MIGSRLSEKLLARGFSVSILSRSMRKIPGVKVHLWNPEKKEIDTKAIEKADYIVHLAGENLSGKRWTKERKNRIYDSRIKSAALIFERTRVMSKKPKAFISASAIGYYGAVTSEKIFKETDPPNYDFLSTVCVKWEEMADNFKTIGMRVVKIRTSPVLSRQGGVLDQLKKPVEFGVGAAIGNGRQYFPWIHIDDLCTIYTKAIEEERMKGAYNAAAPEHVSNEIFMETLARLMNKPFWFPKVPVFVMKLIFGEMGETALKGSRISSEKIREAGFEFLFPQLEDALKDVLGEQKSKNELMKAEKENVTAD